MRMFFLLLILMAPGSVLAGEFWTCHRSDGSRVFQDFPCDEREPPLRGVMDAPVPHANAPNPGWCAAHLAWRDQARNKSETVDVATEAMRWRAAQQQHERWLKSHHCQ